MNFSHCLIIVFLIYAAAIAAGCTQGTGPAALESTVPVTGPGLPDLAIRLSDVPVCFSVTDQHTKTPGEVGQLAKELGWQAGYEVTYTCAAAGVGPTVLVHSLAVYPAVNMPGIVSMVDKQDRAAGFLYEDLEFPDKGPSLRGFYGKAGATAVSGSTAGTGQLAGTGSVPEINANTRGDVAEIIISRGTHLSVLKMTGPGTNATILRDLALVAYARIP